MAAPGGSGSPPGRIPAQARTLHSTLGSTLGHTPVPARTLHLRTPLLLPMHSHSTCATAVPPGPLQDIPSFMAGGDTGAMRIHSKAYDHALTRR